MEVAAEINDLAGKISESLGRAAQFILRGSSLQFHLFDNFVSRKHGGTDGNQPQCIVIMTFNLTKTRHINGFCIAYLLLHFHQSHRFVWLAKIIREMELETPLLLKF